MPAATYRKIFLLADCNNFFVSCERLFRPDLAGRPAVVLSGNDGRVIARSPEAKALGIAMGTPAFQIRELIDTHRICVFSSNLNLYLDISRRIMAVLGELCPEVEAYSVDEAFLICEHMSADEATDLAYRVRHTVLRHVGVPVSLGVARTRTLAKLASREAKRGGREGGVCSLLDEGRRMRVLRECPVQEVWGIGGQLSAGLQAQGITTAMALAACDAEVLRRRYSVTISRTVDELNNRDRSDAGPPYQGQMQIMWSRTFSTRLTERDELAEALSNYVVLAAERLRQAGRYARRLSIHIRTPRFGDQPRYSAQRTQRFSHPTHDSRLLLGACLHLLDQIYRPGFGYAKAGVLLSELSDIRDAQQELFTQPPTDDELQRGDLLMATLDHINRHGRGTLRLLPQGQMAQGPRFLRQRALSPRYTTVFSELPRVR